MTVHDNSTIIEAEQCWPFAMYISMSILTDIRGNLIRHEFHTLFDIIAYSHCYCTNLPISHKLFYGLTTISSTHSAVLNV